MSRVRHCNQESDNSDSWPWRPTLTDETGKPTRPWTVYCSAEGTRSASTISVTCKFAGDRGVFNLGSR
jgi:hypothetical protein